MKRMCGCRSGDTRQMQAESGADAPLKCSVGEAAPGVSRRLVTVSSRGTARICKSEGVGEASWSAVVLNSKGGQTCSRSKDKVSERCGRETGWRRQECGIGIKLCFELKRVKYASRVSRCALEVESALVQ